MRLPSIFFTKWKRGDFAACFRKEKKILTLNPLANRFDEHFRLDENGLPKRWAKHDDVASCFTQARKNVRECLAPHCAHTHIYLYFSALQAYAVLDLCAIIRLEEAHRSLSFLNLEAEGEKEPPLAELDQKIIAIPYDECRMLQDRFKKESEQAYVSALREQEGKNSSMNIPPFFWVVMVVLGFNEFYALLSNPLLLVGFLLFGTACWVMWFLGFADVPLEIASTLATDALQSARSWLVTTVVNKVTQPAKPHSD